MIVFSVLIFLFGATVYCILAADQYRSVVKLRIIPPAVSGGDGPFQRERQFRRSPVYHSARSSQ